VETGLGGLLDSSNTVSSSNKLAVISRIGLDHTRILGKSITAITQQKAGIIQDGNTVLALKQSPTVNLILRERAEKKNASITFCDPPHQYILQPDNTFTFNWEDWQLSGLVPGSPALYQRENYALALTALVQLSLREHWTIKPGDLKNAFSSIKYPGRFEIISQWGKEYIIDGAHNPQKMHALLQSLKEYLPGQKFEFLLAFRTSQACREMLQSIIPYATRITLVSLYDSSQPQKAIGVKPYMIAAKLRGLDCANLEIFPGTLAEIQEMIKNYPGKRLIITGSLYFISAIYPAFHGDF
jgi:dihydrofolate synthase/folylpolyglutamate synthase